MQPFTSSSYLAPGASSIMHVSVYCLYGSHRQPDFQSTMHDTNQQLQWDNHAKHSQKIHMASLTLCRVNLLHPILMFMRNMTCFNDNMIYAASVRVTEDVNNPEEYLYMYVNVSI